MDTKELIGNRIKELRKKRGLSQEQLSEKAEITPNYLSRVERGTENPTLDMLIRLANALEVEIMVNAATIHQIHGIQEVGCSIPLSSTRNNSNVLCCSCALSARPFHISQVIILHSPTTCQQQWGKIKPYVFIIASRDLIKV